MVNEANINYRLSLNIIKGLMDKNLITREEFDAIDKENKKQVSYYTQYITSKPDWELVEVYADEGISATTASKRKEFL